MWQVSVDPRVPEPTQENVGKFEHAGGGHLNNGVLEKFAQSMTENIIESFKSQMVAPGVDHRLSAFKHQEMLAEELASAVTEDALREVSRSQNVEDRFDCVCSSGTKMNGRQVNLSNHPPLTQSGLPIMGSLDYPDAPPTTPLLPELERTRHSFARKLKGGLAKVFLPSPPPPTPKDKEDISISAAVDPQVELMQHLMDLLHTDDLTGDCYEEGLRRGVMTEAFAEALSCDIMDWALKVKVQISDDIDIHLCAQRLAEAIITSSLDEARLLV